MLLVYFLLAALLHGCIPGYSEEVIAESGGAERSNKDGCERLAPAGSCLAGLQAGKVSLEFPGAPCSMTDGGAGALPGAPCGMTDGRAGALLECSCGHRLLPTLSCKGGAQER